MDIQERWEKAIEKTRIIRSRVKELSTFNETNLPYIFLAEALVNVGDTVVREGEVVVEKPSIVLPFNAAHFEGFEFDKDFDIQEDMVMNFLFVRGVSFPSMKYNNRTSSLNLRNGNIDEALTYYSNMLEQKEDVQCGLIVGPEDCWQFSVLIFICSQVVKSADTDIRRLIDNFRKRFR